MQEETAQSSIWPELNLPFGFWEETRIAPNILVRSAAFSTLDYTGGAVRPEVMEPLKLSALSQYKIDQVAGVRLSQTDADLFFWLLSRLYRYGAPKDRAWVYFKRSEALTGRARGGKTDLLLEDSLQRLIRAEFSYEALGVVGRTRLLSSVERFDEDKPYDFRVTVSDGVAQLLANGDWMALSGTEREELAGDSLAKALHAFYSSHITVYPMFPATLKSLTGRESMQESKWRHALKKSLARVQEVTGWAGCHLVENGDNAGKVVVRKGVISSRSRKRVASVAKKSRKTPTTEPCDS